MQTKRPETLRFQVLLARREGFEPPAFWSVGCLTHKSESFRLRFVLFTTVRSADLPLFPSSPARFFRILGQNWVKRSPAEYRWPPKWNWFILSEKVRAENCSDFSHIFQNDGRIVHKFYGIIWIRKLSNKSGFVEGNIMQGINNMLLGITIMIASIAFYSIYDNNTIAVIIAFIGLCISIYGYSKRER